MQQSTLKVVLLADCMYIMVAYYIIFASDRNELAYFWVIYFV